MAGNGPAPSPTKRRRNKDPIETTEIVVDGAPVDELAGFDLPPMQEGTWHPMTQALWLALRRSPLLTDEPELGWLFLLDTALMHHTMWEKGRWEFAAELRLRLAKYGVTPEDRARLRIKITTPSKEKAPAADASPTAANSRRRGLHIAG